MEAKIIKAQGHAIYVVCKAPSQPWAAKCVRAESGETIKREWCKVRHARDTEAKAAKMDSASAWVAIFAWDADGYFEIGKLAPDENGKDRLYLQIKAQAVTLTTRTAIEEALFEAPTAEAEDISDLPF